METKRELGVQLVQGRQDIECSRMCSNKPEAIDKPARYKKHTVMVIRDRNTSSKVQQQMCGLCLGLGLTPRVCARVTFIHLEQYMTHQVPR